MSKETPLHEELEEYSLDAIVVLGTTINTDANGNWYLPQKFELPNQNIGGQFRIESLSVAFQRKLAPIFLMTSGLDAFYRGQKVPNAARMAEIAQDLYQIPPETFEIIGKRGSTWGNILDTVEYFENNPEMLVKKRIGVLSNAYHMPRAMRFFRSHPFFTNIDLEILPSETLLTRSDSANLERVINLYRSEEMGPQIGSERKGVKDFKNGTYGFRDD